MKEILVKYLKFFLEKYYSYRNIVILNKLFWYFFTM
jgi:hypothetical protein